MKGQSILTALKMDNPDMLEWALSEESIGIDEQLEVGNTPLQLAVTWRASDCVEYLLQKGAAPDCHFNGFSPLIIAAQEGLTNIAAILLDGKADINFHGQHGLTPLMAAARDGHIKTVRLLLDRGVDAEDTTDAGTTALMMAELSGQVDTAELIKKHLESRYQTLSPAFFDRFVVVKDPGDSD
jgi:uncharacterized protein